MAFDYQALATMFGEAIAEKRIEPGFMEDMMDWFEYSTLAFNRAMFIRVAGSAEQHKLAEILAKQARSSAQADAWVAKVTGREISRDDYNEARRKMQVLHPSNQLRSVPDGDYHEYE